MTYDTFLSCVAAFPGWYLTSGGRIRRKNPDKPYEECPICALHPSLFSDYWTAGTQLGLPYELFHAIADAADNLFKHDPQIRADLLAATGLG